MKRSLLLLTLFVLALSALSYGQFNGTGWSGGIGYGATFAKTDLANGTRFIARGFIRKGITEKIGAELGLVAVAVQVTQWNARFFNALEARNWAEFQTELVTFCFIAVGAMIDFSPLLKQPVMLFFGAAAQFGIFAALACFFQFPLRPNYRDSGFPRL